MITTEQLIASLQLGAEEATGIYLYDMSVEGASGPYLEWSARRDDGVVFEAGDGDDAVLIALTWDQLADLHRRLTVTLLSRQP